MRMRTALLAAVFPFAAWAADGNLSKPYSPPCTEREDTFEFTERPKVKSLGNDKYEITFAVKANCDVTVGIVDAAGRVIRHLGSGVLGPNAPLPFQKNRLKQTIYWDGKEDLDDYVKEPGKLRVRVMLGLKPIFDKRLGGTSPRNLPGKIWGIAADEEGVYVFTRGEGGSYRVQLRRFDHDGNYVQMLSPPAANLPPEKLGGMGYIEYEPGKKAIHGPFIHYTLTQAGWYAPDGNGGGEIRGVEDCQPAVAGKRLFFCNAGQGYYFRDNSYLHYFHTDGSTDVKGMFGRAFGPLSKFLDNHCYPRMAASPDGKWIYFVGIGGGSQGYTSANAPAVIRCTADGDEPAKVFAGDPKTPGNDDAHLNFPSGVDCDAQGRVYVADAHNNRVQIFSDDAKFLKTLPVDRPAWVGVHRKTGAVYVAHSARVQGKSVGCVTRFSPFPELKEVFHVDGLAPAVAAVDSHSPKPRLWMGGREYRVKVGAGDAHGAGLTVWEDDGAGLRKILDFQEAARKEDGPTYAGHWGGGTSKENMIACDPTREQLYYRSQTIFDLRTGLPLKGFDSARSCPGVSLSEARFDKSGYMHCYTPAHLDGVDGVYRLDPSRVVASEDGESLMYSEIPYDYGDEKSGRWNARWKGVLAMYRPDHHLWSWGLGVNMRGDVAVCVHVEFAPKLETEAYQEGFAGVVERQKMGLWTGAWVGYETWIKAIREQEKQGIRVLYLPRHPGQPVTGGTIWTYDRTGELREESAVISGRHNNGVQLDEDGNLYFTHARVRMCGNKPFLFGAAGHFGTDKSPGRQGLSTFTGTYLKTRGSKVRFLLQKAMVQMDLPPERPPELVDPNVFGAVGQTGNVWVEGAEWFYAGASPIVPGGCNCPQIRAHLDWYKRSYVPEAYRHSIGILDANGNLIMHLGQYGNFDSALGPGSRIPLPGDGIGFTHLEYIDGTDDYLCFSDSGERITVLKLAYHAEEAAPVRVE